MIEVDYLTPTLVFGPSQLPLFNLKPNRNLYVDLRQVMVAKTYPCRVIVENEDGQDYEEFSSICLELIFPGNVSVCTIYKNEIGELLEPKRPLKTLNESLEIPHDNKQIRKYEGIVQCQAN